MKTTALTAELRTGTGRRACHKLRRSGFVPANLYASEQVDGKTANRNTNLVVSAYDLEQILAKHATVLDVTYDGKTELCQLTEIQRDAFGSSVLHCDLRLIDKNKKMEGHVGLVFKGDAIGLKNGGLLRTALRDLEVSALPVNMPLEIVVNVEHLDINDALHVGELKLPEGVTAVTNSHQLVVQVVPPALETEDEAEEEAAGDAASEPEVIAKGKKEEE